MYWRDESEMMGPRARELLGLDQQQPVEQPPPMPQQQPSPQLGLPGERYAGRDGRLASLLMQQQKGGTNNGSVAGGVAHILEQFIRGYMMNQSRPSSGPSILEPRYQDDLGSGYGAPGVDPILDDPFLRQSNFGM